MIIGIAGVAGSGKDTVADHLVKKHGFVKVALADPLKRICKDVFNFSNEQLWGPSEKRNEGDTRYPIEVTYPESTRTFVKYLTPRHALQQLGTEWGRACYENVWVDYALRVAKTIMFGQEFKVHDKKNYNQQLGLYPWNESPMEAIHGIVIPDIRFKNEMKAVQEAGGKIWRVVRPGAGLTGAAGQHSSETSLDGVEDGFTVTIKNDTSLEELYDMIDISHGLTFSMQDTQTQLEALRRGEG